MPKPDATLLQVERYPFSCTIEPRFGDLDVNLHINNVAMAGMLEDGRVRFYRAASGEPDFHGLSTMIASISIEYMGETHYPDPITIHAAIENLGRTSQQIVQIVTQNGKPVVFARTVVVMTGPDGPAPLPAEYRTRAERWILRP